MCTYNPRNYDCRIWVLKGGKNPPVKCGEKILQIPGSLAIKRHCFNHLSHYDYLFYRFNGNKEIKFDSTKAK